MASVRGVLLAGGGLLLGVAALRFLRGQPMLPRAFAQPQLTVIRGGLPEPLKLGSEPSPTVPDFAPVYFALDSAEFPPAGAAEAEAVSKWLLDHPGHVVTCEGHASADGSAQHNLALSRDRALAAGEQLVRRGVPEEAVLIDGRGEADPVASNTTEAGRALNRRVEFKVEAA